MKYVHGHRIPANSGTRQRIFGCRKVGRRHRIPANSGTRQQIQVYPIETKGKYLFHALTKTEKIRFRRQKFRIFFSVFQEIFVVWPCLTPSSSGLFRHGKVFSGPIEFHRMGFPSISCGLALPIW
jgi:hypothetical protein